MATAWLVEQTMGREVRCVGDEKDRYDRVVARCYLGGTELSSSIVQAGWALAYRQYSTDYVDVENVARERGIGIWRGQFTSPWEWRTGKRLAGTTEKNSQSGRCLIKGNISRSGARIFHVPGGAYYSRTRIDLSRGERWFCTEEEAIAAKWRRSKR